MLQFSRSFLFCIPVRGFCLVFFWGGRFYFLALVSLFSVFVFVSFVSLSALIFVEFLH